MRWLIVAASVLAVGCSAVKPLPVVVGDRCYGCQKSIEDVKLAAELIDEGGHAFKFGSAGCLARYLAEHKGEHYKGLFVTDYSTGKFVEASEATFAKITVNPSTLEKEYVAYRSRDTAAAAAKDAGSTTLEWDAVLAAAATP